MLEDRTLLSVTSLFFNGDLTVLSDADDAIVIREDPLQVGRVEVLVGTTVGGTLTYTPDTSIGVLNANVVETILVGGGDGANIIDLGDGQGLGGVDTTIWTSLVGVTIEGGNGNDTITGTINFSDMIDAGDGNDIVTVGSAGVTADGGDGNDTLTGGVGADVLSGGDGNDEIHGLTGADTIDAGNGHDLVNGGDEPAGTGDSIIGGHGHDTLVGGNGDDWINGKSGHDSISGGNGSDVMHGGSGRDQMEGGAGDDTINGHGYNDTILGNGGSDRINGHWGHDFLDGDDASGGTTAGNDTVLGGAGRDTLLGNLGDDLLRGQGGRDTLVGGQGLDKLDGGGGHDLLRGFQQQVVFLDFDSETDSQTEHAYTAGQRAAIRDNLATDFAAFDLDFTLEPPDTGSLYLQDGAYVEIVFNDTLTASGPGIAGAGESSDYDFRNLDLGGRVSIDVLGSGGLVGGSGQPAATSDNIIAASSYVAAHQLGYLMGLRDVDSFGSLSASTGITDPPGATAFNPAFPGPANATETASHIMASPGLLGGVIDFTADLFLSERSAIKLAFNEAGLSIGEMSGAHGTLTAGGSQQITLRALGVPNTLESGLNSGKILDVEAAAVIGGSIGAAGEIDVYSFEGVGGQVVSIEVFSAWLSRISDPIDTIVRVYDSAGTPVPYHSSDSSSTDIAVNDNFDDGSGQPVTDPILINLTLPTTGNFSDTYYIEIAEPPTRGLFALSTDGSDQVIELDPRTGIELNRFDLPAGESESGQAALAYDSTGDRLFFMNGDQGVLFELDPGNGSEQSQTTIVSPIGTSTGAYDGLAYYNDRVYILDVQAETVPGQAQDDNADPPVMQVLDAPEILIFDPNVGQVTDYLNLVGTGEGTKPAANAAGTFGNITGGLAAIAPNGASPRLLLLDNRGATVHEIDPASGASTLSYGPLGVGAGTYDAVGGYAGQVWLGTGTGGVNRVEVYDRGASIVSNTLALTPNAPPSYNLTAFGADDNIATNTETGEYELFITKVDPGVALAGTSVGDTLLGGSGNDTLFGGSASDILKGGSGDDTGSGLGGYDHVNAGSGDDTMRGGLDNDTMLGGSGSDRLFGDAGDDTLDGQGSSDTLDGGAGDDVLKWQVGKGSDVMNNSDGSARVEASGSADADSLSVTRTSGNRPKLVVTDGTDIVTISKKVGRTDVNGGDGNDTMLVGSLEDVSGTLVVINGDDGDDTLSAASVRIGDVRLRLDGGDGADTLTGSLDGDTLWGGLGDDRADGGRGDDTMVGGEGDDDFDGQDGDDVIIGNDGNDTLDGGEGHDSLSGNAGFDSLTGGIGRDTLSGGDDDDALSGSQHDDSLMGDAGQDSLYGGTGNDYLHGGLNDDRLYGNVGNDTIGGGHGHDLLEGAEGDDILNGGDGDDTLMGEEGFDGLSGHDGDDDINGGGDDDTILGGDGHDALAGGGGRDIVLGGDGNDTIDGQGASDTLAGNEGADTITGQANEINETFTFYESWVDSV